MKAELAPKARALTFYLGPELTDHSVFYFDKPHPIRKNDEGIAGLVSMVTCHVCNNYHRRANEELRKLHQQRPWWKKLFRRY